MARRYRPATFDQVVGQEHIAATLKNAITRDRVAHAYIFTGGHGCGKTTMARILAKALVCEQGPTSEPCGVCPVCVDVAAGRDSDVLEIDGASNNGIEQIRQLREQAGYVPTRARYKIYIIDEVHMLSDGAFNALLKTLEEPPRHVKFILATTDPHKVPNTILSRCQRFDFRLVPPAKLSAFFRRLAGQEQAAITDDALDAVAANAEGSVRDGLVLLDQLLSFADGEVTRQDVEGVRGVAPAESVAGVFSCFASSDVAGALRIVDEVTSRGTNVGDFLDQLITFGRDLMILAATGSTDSISVYGPAREALLRLGEATRLETALLYLDVLAQARTRVRSRALSNPMVALEMAIARLSGLGGVTPVSEILARLDQLPAASPEERSAPPPPEPGRLAAAPGATTGEKSVQAAEPEPAPPPAAAEWLYEAPSLPPAEEPKPETPEPPFEATHRIGPAPFNPPEPEPVAAVKAEDAPPAAVKPAPPPESPAEPLTMASVQPQWEAILDRLADKYPADFRHMARISLENADGDTLHLSGPGPAVDAWNDRRRLERLTETVAAVLGRTVTFEFTEKRAGRTVADGDAEAQAKYQLARHPAVDQVKSLFDGVIINCQTAADVAGIITPDGDDETGDDE